MREFIRGHFAEVIERLVGEARRLGMHVVVETAPDLADEEYDGGTMAGRE